MKQKILAILLFVIIIGFVVTNTIVLQKAIDTLTNDVKALKVDAEKSFENALKIDETFKKKVSYIGLTVSHDDLTNIEDCFAELSGYLSVGDTNGAEVAKYRLIRFLGHLRRLVGFNIDAVI